MTRVSRYYLSGSDAFRLKLMLPLHPDRLQALKDEEIAAEQLKQLSIPPEANGSAMQDMVQWEIQSRFGPENSPRN